MGTISYQIKNVNKEIEIIKKRELNRNLFNYMKNITRGLSRDSNGQEKDSVNFPAGRLK